MKCVLPMICALVLPAGLSAQWEQRTNVGSPGARTGHAMAYDKHRGVTVLFGGSIGPGGEETYFDDTWEYNGNQWTRITITGPYPDNRAGHAMCYDTVKHRVFLVGGVNEDGYPGDTWTYQSTGPGTGAWTYHGSMAGRDEDQHALAGSALAFDESRGTAIRIMGFGILTPEGTSSPAVYGKSRNIVYYSDFGNPNVIPHWENMAIHPFSTFPTTRACAAYDPVSKTVMYHGGEANNPAYAYNDSKVRGVDLGEPRYTSNPAHPELGVFLDYEQNPSIRGASFSGSYGTQEAAMVYDPVRDRLVVFGGQGSPEAPLGAATREFLRDPNNLDDNIWNGAFIRVLTNNPPPRASHAMVYDAARKTIVLFGGASGSTRYGDTWELPSIPAAGPIWVDPSHTGGNFGSVASPFTSLADAIRYAPGREIRFNGPGSSPETGHFSPASPVTLTVSGGPFTIGQN